MIPTGDRIVTFFAAGGRTIVNYTLSDHQFFPGAVVRWLSEENGTVYVNTWGVGIGGNRDFNMQIGPRLFRALDLNIRATFNTTNDCAQSFEDTISLLVG